MHAAPSPGCVDCTVFNSVRSLKGEPKSRYGAETLGITVRFRRMYSRAVVKGLFLSNNFFSQIFQHIFPPRIRGKRGSKKRKHFQSFGKFFRGQNVWWKASHSTIWKNKNKKTEEYSAPFEECGLPAVYVEMETQKIAGKQIFGKIGISWLR